VVAGLSDTWQDAERLDPCDTFTIITTAASPRFSWLHGEDRGHPWAAPLCLTLAPPLLPASALHVSLLSWALCRLVGLHRRCSLSPCSWQTACPPFFPSEAAVAQWLDPCPFPVESCQGTPEAGAYNGDDPGARPCPPLPPPACFSAGK